MGSRSIKIGCLFNFPLPPPMYNKTVLANSVRILTERLPSALVSFGIWVDFGCRDEVQGGEGAAHFAEHMLFKGTPSRSAARIALELDLLGGQGNAFTGSEQTCFHVTVLSDHLPRAVELFSDLFLNSSFEDDEMERERQVILQEISMVEDTPDDRVHEIFAGLLWDGHPMGRTVLGSPGVVAGMEAGSLKEIIRMAYQPERIIIAAAGDIDHRSFVDLWERTFGRIQSRADPGLSARTAPAPPEARIKVISRPLEQVHMVLGGRGLPANAPRRYALLLLNIILGGNMSSRLFQEIREKRGLAYSVYSYLTSFSDCGGLAIYLGIDPGFLKESVRVVRDEINRLIEEGVSGVELAGAVEYARCGMVLGLDQVENRMMRLARNEFAFGREVKIAEIIASIGRVSPDEVVGLAGELLGGDGLVGAAIGPVEMDALTGWVENG